MVIWVECISLKLTFSYGKLYAKFHDFKFAYWWRLPRSLEIYRFTKLSTLIQTEFFQFLSKICTYLRDIHNSENDSGVRGSGFLYGLINKKKILSTWFCFFLWIEGTSLAYKIRNSYRGASLYEHWCFTFAFQITCKRVMFANDSKRL